MESFLFYSLFFLLGIILIFWGAYEVVRNEEE